MLRPQDKLRLFELMPQDARALLGNAEQLLEGRQAQVLMEDGFANAKKFLPPPDRRGLLLCDPSYEMKTDYAKVATFIDDSLRRFATGYYAVWYPIIGRQEAHDLPKRLKSSAAKAGKNWLHATLTVNRASCKPWPMAASNARGCSTSGMCASSTRRLPCMQHLKQLCRRWWR